MSRKTKPTGTYVRLIENRLTSGWSDESIENLFIITGLTLGECILWDSKPLVEWILENNPHIDLQGLYNIWIKSLVLPVNDDIRDMIRDILIDSGMEIKG